MHQPGYVQGGQEVGRNYLLLRIHVRRIRGIDIAGIFAPNHSSVFKTKDDAPIRSYCILYLHGVACMNRMPKLVYILIYKKTNRKIAEVPAYICKSFE
jgi:hypothetical protein